MAAVIVELLACGVTLSTLEQVRCCRGGGGSSCKAVAVRNPRMVAHMRSASALLINGSRSALRTCESSRRPCQASDCDGGGAESSAAAGCARRVEAGDYCRLRRVTRARNPAVNSTASCRHQQASAAGVPLGAAPPSPAFWLEPRRCSPAS
eukprot:351219-Chlamydomonas_euryale.AAC.8